MQRRFGTWTAGLALALTMGLGCGGGGGGGVTGPGGTTAVTLEPITTGLDLPVFLTASPGDPTRLFVLEQHAGRIRVIENGVLLDTPFLDLGGSVSTGFEQGLLGLAFDPGYATNKRFYVNYTNTSGDTRVVRYFVSSDPNRADASTASQVLAVDQPDAQHNGGMLAFGHDGYLYVGMGDGNGETGSDPGNHGQDKTELLGSILRLDVSGASGYAIPTGNPYANGVAGRPELWNSGLRNPWRFSFDRQTGDLYIGDVGEGQREEVDVALVSRGLGAGANYGWKIIEGTRCADPAHCGDPGFTAPVLEYTHAEGQCVVGGYVYRGSALPALRGTYFYGDFASGWVRSFRIINGVALGQAEWPTLEPGGSITSFGEDSRGELYVLTRQGGVYKVVAAAS